VGSLGLGEEEGGDPFCCRLRAHSKSGQFRQEENTHTYIHTHILVGEGRRHLRV